MNEPINDKNIPNPIPIDGENFEILGLDQKELGLVSKLLWKIQNYNVPIQLKEKLPTSLLYIFIMTLSSIPFEQLFVAEPSLLAAITLIRSTIPQTLLAKFPDVFQNSKNINQDISNFITKALEENNYLLLSEFSQIFEELTDQNPNLLNKDTFVKIIEQCTTRLEIVIRANEDNSKRRHVETVSLIKVNQDQILQQITDLKFSLMSSITGYQNDIVSEVKLVPKWFVDRSENLNEVVDSLILKDKPLVYIIRGSTGIGKSAFVNKLCHEKKIRDFFTDGIFSLDLRDNGNPENIKAWFLNKILKHNSSCPYTNETPFSNLASEFCSIFQDKKILFILDNLENFDLASELNKFIPVSGDFAFVVTTQKSWLLKEFPNNSHEYTKMYEIDEVSEVFRLFEIEFERKLTDEEEYKIQNFLIENRGSNIPGILHFLAQNKAYDYKELPELMNNSEIFLNLYEEMDETIVSEAKFKKIFDFIYNGLQSEHERLVLRVLSRVKSKFNSLPLIKKILGEFIDINRQSPLYIERLITPLTKSSILIRHQNGMYTLNPIIRAFAYTKDPLDSKEVEKIRIIESIYTLES